MAYVLTYLDGSEETVPAAFFKGVFTIKREKVMSYKKIKLPESQKKRR